MLISQISREMQIIDHASTPTFNAMHANVQLISEPLLKELKHGIL